MKKGWYYNRVMFEGFWYPMLYDVDILTSTRYNYPNVTIKRRYTETPGYAAKVGGSFRPSEELLYDSADKVKKTIIRDFFNLDHPIKINWIK